MFLKNRITILCNSEWTYLVRVAFIAGSLSIIVNIIGFIALACILG